MTRSLTESMVDGTHINVKSRTHPHNVQKTNLESLFDKYEARTEMLYCNRFGRNSKRKGLKMKSLEAITSDIDRTVLNSLPHDTEDYPDESSENEYFNSEDDMDNITDFNDNANRTVREEAMRKLSLRSQDTDSTTQTQYDKSKELEMKRIKSVNNLIKGKRGWSHFRRVFMVSAATGDGITELKVCQFKFSKNYNVPKKCYYGMVFVYPFVRLLISVIMSYKRINS